jgi:hypothetical protein
LTGDEEVVIISDSEESPGEEDDEDNEGFIPIDKLEPEEATVLTKVTIQRKRKMFTYSSSSGKKR